MKKYKGFCQKYKGKFGFLNFCLFCPILFPKNYFEGHRSICQINSVLLTPILPYLMPFYALWHLPWNAIKWHFIFFNGLLGSLNGLKWIFCRKKNKGFCQKYNGKFGFLYFCLFCPILFLKNYFEGHRSICLINSVLLIPILPYFMSFYALWHMPWNAIKWQVYIVYRPVDEVAPRYPCQGWAIVRFWISDKWIPM